MSSKFNDWVREFEIKPSGLIHAGAHLAQEREEYASLGFEPVIWFEASPQIYKQASEILRHFPNQDIINRALWSVSGIEKTFHVAGNQGSSSSLLEPYLISASHPEVVTTSQYKIITSTLDEEMSKIISDAKYRVLVLDVQGAEIEVLKGAASIISEIDYVVTEVSILELYKGNTQIKQIVDFLSQFGFEYAASEINRATGWGEGLFIRKSITSARNDRLNAHVVVGKKIAKGRLVRTFLIKVKNLLITRISRD